MSNVDPFDRRTPSIESSTSPEIGDLAGALAKAQGMMRGAVKDQKNPFFKSSYADLASCWEACREALSANDLAVIQTTELSDIGIVIVTTLAHKSGQWIRGKLRMVPQKNDPQVIGSAITYARRYALAAIVGLAQVDDDGEAAMNRGPMNGDAIDTSKISRIVDSVLNIIENEDPEMIETPRLAKEIYAPLTNDERMALQPILKETKIGKKTAWSVFRAYLDLAAKESEAA